MRTLVAWLLNRMRPSSSDDLPFKVTEENLEEIRRRFPWLLILQYKKCPFCQSYLVGAEVRRCSKYQMLHQSQNPRLLPTIYCPFCQRQTLDDPWVPDNETPPLEVRPFLPNWVRCPCCGWKFSLDNPSSWTGECHRKCGQRLIIRSFP